MKIEWNWGTKLLLAMILFMLLLLTFMVMSMKQSFYLVEKDYYPRALEYQNKIDKIENVKLLGEKVKIENMGDHVQFSFQQTFIPNEIKGDIVFYRPSDGRLDITFPIQPDTAGQQLCNISSMTKGKYIVKLDYEVGGTGYYQEETILLKMY